MAEENKIIDVQKNYSDDVIQEIQRALNNNIAEINVIDNVNELPTTIYLDGIKVVFSNNGRYDTCMYMDQPMDSSSLVKWKSTSLSKFYMKDWKRLNKNIDIFENNNYLELHFKVKDADVIALLRRVDIELKDDEFALMEYGDIEYNNIQYTVVKAFIPTLKEEYQTNSILENEFVTDKLYDNNGYEILNINGNIIENDSIEIVSINDVPDIESEELF